MRGAGRGGQILSALSQDFGFAIRAWRRSPGFAATVIGSIALAIAINATVFSLANAVLFRPLSVHQPEALANVYATDRGSGSFLLSYPEYTELREVDSALADATAHAFTSLSVRVGENVQRWSGEIVSGNYFRVLGVDPFLGRGFLDDEDVTPGTRAVVVVSERFWQRHMGANADAVGQTLSLNAQPFTVVGVAPRGFAGTFPGGAADFWIPTMMFDFVRPRSDTLLSRASRRFDVTVRLDSPTDLSRVRAVVETLAARQQQEFPGQYRDHGFIVEPARGVRPGMKRILGPAMFVVLALVGVVLVVACLNVATLLLVRASSRTHELAIRGALGAGRVRIAAQLLMETAILGVAGGVLGFAIAAWASMAISGWQPNLGIALHFDLRPDRTTVAYTAALTLLTTILSGVAPVFAGMRQDVAPLLRQQTRSGGRAGRAFRNLLVTGQLTLSIVLLTGAALVIQSVRAAALAHPGFEVEGLGIISLDLGLLRADRDRSTELFSSLLEQARNAPRVQQASLGRFTPLGAAADQRPAIADDGSPSGIEIPRLYYNVVTPGYFATLGIPLLRGRDFTVGDGTGSPRVGVINEAFARLISGGGGGVDPVGSRIRLDGGDESLEVVGVVKDIKYRSVAEPPLPYLFLPLGQHIDEAGAMSVHLRTNADVNSVTRALVDDFRRLEPDLPVSYFGPIQLSQRVGDFARRFLGTILTVSGALALLLAAVGLYGTTAHTVARRLPEMGIRIAIGARGGDIRRLVVTGALKVGLVGLGLGLLIAAGLGRLAGGLLFGVRPVHIPTFLTVALLLLLVSVLAALGPARKAGKSDPMNALRAE